MQSVPREASVVELESSSSADRVTMDIFEHRYYRLNKTFMTLLGRWPYQTARARRGIAAVRLFIAVSGLVPATLAFVKYRDDFNVFLECVISGLFVAVSVMKFFCIVLNSQKDSYVFMQITIPLAAALVRALAVSVCVPEYL